MTNPKQNPLTKISKSGRNNSIYCARSFNFWSQICNQIHVFVEFSNKDTFNSLNSHSI